MKRVGCDRQICLRKGHELIFEVSDRQKLCMMTGVLELKVGYVENQKLYCIGLPVVSGYLSGYLSYRATCI
ncbi:MAG: hypothetical protein HC780_20000 [Leptolyngbyaceae cyanobacterium CSU_1_3]|nr:hypothetical protein [Leptolyngbyaceae cyanobacterium CSU_1_3]